MKFFYILTFLISLPVFPQESFPEIDQLIKLGELKRAKELLHSSSTKSNLHLSYLGDISGYEEDWDKAIDYYKQLVEREPTNANYHFKYGGALGLKALAVSKFQALGYISDIKEHLEKAAHLDRKHTNFRQALVELYLKLPGIIGGSEQKSRKYAAELANIDPVKGALAMAFISDANGENEKAKEYNKEALALFNNRNTSSKDNSLYFKLGKISAEYQIYPSVGLKVLDEFIEDYSVKNRDALEWAYFYKARIHAQLNEKQEALKSIEKALTLKDNFKEAQAEKHRILALK